jgi:hypothetical protein
LQAIKSERPVFETEAQEDSDEIDMDEYHNQMVSIMGEDYTYEKAMRNYSPPMANSSSN